MTMSQTALEPCARPLRVWPSIDHASKIISRWRVYLVINYLVHSVVLVNYMHLQLHRYNCPNKINSELYDGTDRLQ